MAIGHVKKERKLVKASLRGEALKGSLEESKVVRLVF